MTSNIPQPDKYFNFAQHIIERNTERPNKIAYIDNAATLSYGALSHRIQCVAAALLDKGLHPGERVLLLMHDVNDWPICFLGAIYAGIIPVAVNTLLTADNYSYMLQHSQSKAVLVSEALLPTILQAISINNDAIDTLIVAKPRTKLPDNIDDLDRLIEQSTPLKEPCKTRADGAAFWLYSSGTTGDPKGTVHSHSNPYWTAELYGTGTLKIREGDICFSAAKLFFAYGLGNSLSFPLSVGATVILLSDRPTPAAVFQRWIDHQPTIFFGAPTGYAGMLASPDLPNKQQVSLRLASSAGEALPAELGKRFTEHFDIEIIDGIGSTEMLHIYISNIPGQVIYGSSGWPVLNYDIELRNDNGQIAKDGEIGDLYVKGPSTAIEYWNAPEKTKETFQGAWTMTGDKYIRNSNGSFTYSGRSDDMLKVSGIYISPFEVEAALIQHPAVLESAVVGKIDHDGLVKTKAFVVLKEGQSATKKALQAFVKERLAPYKYPRYIEFIEALPKTATGKIQRYKLRE